jgi:hypothetical protein
MAQMSPKNITGINNMMSGLFTLLNNPYSSASDQYKKYATQAGSYQQPFYQAGVSSIAPYQESLSKMADPQEYFNSIMSGYSSSPYAKYEQQNAMNAATNSASASGLTGSTPLMMQEQQTASDISSQDMDKYFADILGINQDYLKGLDSLIKGGQQSANQLTDIAQQMMRLMGASAFGKTASTNKAYSQELGGLEEIASIFGL